MPYGRSKERFLQEVGIIMSTYMAKANEIEKKWYIIDAAGKPLGRVAVKTAK